MKKKTFIYSSMLLLGLTLGMTSCSKDDNSNGTPITENEQKTKLESTAKEFVGYFDSSNFESVSKTIQGMADKYDNVETDAYDKWLENCLKSMDEIISSKDQHYSNNWYSWIETSREINRLYTLTKFKGNFSIKNNKIVRTDANNLSITAVDENGKTCTATVTYSGKTVKMDVGQSNDEYYDYDGQNHYYYDVINNTVEIPENVNIVVTRDKETLMSVALKTDVSKLKDNFDIAKINASLTLDINLQDYRINVEKMTADSQAGASTTTKMYKNGKNIMTISASANGKVFNDDNVGINDVNLSIDILGKVQIKGNCKDFDSFNQYLKKIDNCDNNETELKNYIAQANKFLDLGLYYDNNATKRANVSFEPISEKSYGTEYWGYDIVIRFGDETSYSTLSDFFNEDNFKDLKNLLDKMSKSYEDLFN